jgi:outer membrane protein OmpA-like peptidoglycan-associated protein
MAAGGVQSLPGMSQDISADDMVEALKPRKSRSATGQAGLPPEDQQFIDGLKVKTRSIMVEERQQLANVITANKLPNLDLEIYFAYDSSAIAPEALGSLEKLGTALSDPQLATSGFVVSGHTDARGPEEYNQQLSEARARSVKRFLEERFNIASQRLISVGFGEEQLRDKAHPEADENRRVTIVNVGP